MTIYYQGCNQRAFGTYPLKNGKLFSALSTAIEVGYRAIDTAQLYENESEIGECLANISIKRSELCLTTKVYPKNFHDSLFLASVEASLKKLRVDFADVLLLHWPPADGDVKPSIKLLNQAKTRGLAKNIGVSNYNSAMMREAVATSDEPIITNQIEYHPLLDQTGLLATASELGISVSAYCGVARGEIFKHQLLHDIASRYNKNVAQVALRWLLQKGISFNVMSTNPVNIKTNFDVMDFTLSNVDIALIDSLNKQNYRIVNIDNITWE